MLRGELSWRGADIASSDSTKTHSSGGSGVEPPIIGED
jgi:hypothetical protein